VMAPGSSSASSPNRPRTAGRRARRRQTHDASGPPTVARRGLGPRRPIPDPRPGARHQTTLAAPLRHATRRAAPGRRNRAAG
jgi:hypothetical protein